MKNKFVIFVGAIVVIWIASLLVRSSIISSLPGQKETINLNSPQAMQILQKSCYDCHSFQTQWPWYSYMPVVAVLTAHHVEEGREHLDFSNWQQYSKKEQRELHEEILEEIDEKEMPMPGYILLHPEAEITAEEYKILADALQFNSPDNDLTGSQEEMLPDDLDGSREEETDESEDNENDD